MRACHNTWTRGYLTTGVRLTVHAKSLRCDQLILVNKAVSKKERWSNEVHMYIYKKHRQKVTRWWKSCLSSPAPPLPFFDLGASTYFSRYFLLYVKSWDRCYDFKNIFAKKVAKNWRFLLKLLLVFA
jgi:hypothetical protein